mmetsp:Transcript_24403/g.76985  ORF Transcript_24403/g.76985 Transcript_24403/m.76985 type:complete len:145 (-) Transcript_24403:665-1099(-)
MMFDGINDILSAVQDVTVTNHVEPVEPLLLHEILDSQARRLQANKKKAVAQQPPIAHHSISVASDLIKEFVWGKTMVCQVRILPDVHSKAWVLIVKVRLEAHCASPVFAVDSPHVVPPIGGVVTERETCQECIEQGSSNTSPAS